jgi:hypothetical protein
MFTHNKILKHTVLGNLFVLVFIMLFAGDAFLLLYSFFIEIFVSIVFVVSVIFLGHRGPKGFDYRGLFMDFGFLIPILIYFFSQSPEHFVKLIDINFDTSIISSWKFWTILSSVILAQVYIFIQTFILSDDYLLPSPSFYTLDLLARSFSLIAATSAFWIFFKTLEGTFVALIIAFAVKIMAELFIKYVMIDAGLAVSDHQYLFRHKLRVKLFH